MTWIEQLENQEQSSAIGTREWFECIPAAQADPARSLVDKRIPVVMQPQGDASTSCPVVFDDTEFVAYGFDDNEASNCFVGPWNNRG